jgi:hypothetical protein
VKHTENCLRAQALASAAQADYDRTWPRYCRSCNGRGQWHETYDPSPAGVCLGPGTLTAAGPCPDCIEAARCPRCARLFTRLHDDAGQILGLDLPCAYCGWQEQDPGRPELPECWCATAEAEAVADRLLADSLPDSLKRTIREALAAGATKKAILTRAWHQAGGWTLTVLAIEQFLDRERGC